GQCKQALFLEVLDRVGVILGLGIGDDVGVGAGEVVGGDALRIGKIADIKEGKLEAFGAAGDRVGVVAETDEVIFVDRLEVGREAGDVEFAFDGGIRRVAEVNG